MKKLSFGFTFLLIVFCLHAQQPETNVNAAQAKAPVVRTTAGVVRGTNRGRCRHLQGNSLCCCSGR